MKLILKEYFASLKERAELDAVLPDLLSRMGMNVFISPSRGFQEYGVDIAAFSEDEKKVYLFSVKAGNLTRSTWSGDSEQSLRWSIDQIMDTFIAARVPPKYKGLDIVICLCFGGDVSSGVRQDFTGYQNRYTSNGLSFEEWNGDKLADLTLTYLLKEELLPKSYQSHLRKSLALIQEPKYSYEHFSYLVKALISESRDNEESAYKTVIKLNLSLWVLFSWAREGKNLEAAYLSAEFTVLNTWQLIKEFKSKKVREAFQSQYNIFNMISEDYIGKCLMPLAEKKHALSNAMRSSCSILINFKLFENLGRLSVQGLIYQHKLESSYIGASYENLESDNNLELIDKIEDIANTLKHMVVNNPLLLSPYKDSHTIDLGLAFAFLSQDSNHDRFTTDWVTEIINRTIFAFETNEAYPTTIEQYDDLLEFRENSRTDIHKKNKVTNASILYPFLMLLCAVYRLEKTGNELQEFMEKELQHTTLQYWHPSSDSQEFYFDNKDIHGVSIVDFDKKYSLIIDALLKECSVSNEFENISAVKEGYKPLLFIASRHYRLPVPIHEFEDLMLFVNENSPIEK